MPLLGRLLPHIKTAISLTYPRQQLRQAAKQYKILTTKKQPSSLFFIGWRSMRAPFSGTQRYGYKHFAPWRAGTEMHHNAREVAKVNVWHRASGSLETAQKAGLAPPHRSKYSYSPGNPAPAGFERFAAAWVLPPILPPK